MMVFPARPLTSCFRTGFFVASFLFVAAALCGTGVSAQVIGHDSDVVDEEAELNSAREILADLAVITPVDNGRLLGQASAALRCWTTAGGADVADACRQTFWTAIDDLRAETDVGAPPVMPGDGSKGLAQIRKEAAEAEAEQAKHSYLQVFRIPYEGADILGPVATILIVDIVERSKGALVLAEAQGMSPLVSRVVEALRREDVLVVENDEDSADGYPGVMVTLRPYRTLALVAPSRK